MIHITHYKTPVHLSNVPKVSRTKTENVTKAREKRKKSYKCFNQVAPQGQLWPRVGSLEDSCISPPSDDPDRKQVEPLSLYTCILLENIASNREECVLCSRPVRRGLMATASRHGSYWHRASKTACKHLHCYELWSWWLMHQSQFDDVVDEGTAGPLLNSDLINNK